MINIFFLAGIIIAAYLFINNRTSKPARVRVPVQSSKKTNVYGERKL